jgi:hypothetical protein
MGWKNSLPVFSTATETIANLVNLWLCHLAPPLPHHLDNFTESIALPDPSPPLHGPLDQVPRDPSLPVPSTQLAYTEVYVDDFVAAAQRSPEGSLEIDNRQQVQRLLLHAVANVFCPLLVEDSPERHEPVYLKKLHAGDCSWRTMKLILSWIINMVAMTIMLPPHRVACLEEIINAFLAMQRQTSMKRWHKTLGELRSMSLTLLGSCNIFSSVQNAMSSQSKGCIALGKGVHDALDNFWWMHWNIATRLMRIAKVLPLPPVAEGHHNVSGMGAGRIWFPEPLLRAHDGYNSLTRVVWQHRWPQHVISRLVTDSNPCGSITNSDLELAGGLLHLNALSNCFDICEHTIFSKGDNLSTTFWERKGSTSTSAALVYLLCLFGVHQCIHLCIPRFDYISGASNHVADAPLQDFHLPWSHMLASLSHYLPQPVSCQLWTPS